MKKISLCLLLMLLTATTGFGQNIQDGIRLFRSGDFERAQLIFDQINDPEAYYYSGRIRFNQGNYLKARSLFQKAAASDDYQLEANFALALTHFQLDDHSKALDILYQIKESGGFGAVGTEAGYFYRDLVNYLSLDQRYDAFRRTDNEQVRYDLIRAAFGKVDLATARVLLDSYTSTVADSGSFEVQRLYSSLTDSTMYAQEFSSVKYPMAPKGITYKVGVALPQFDPDEPQYEISQSLYFGIQLAFERFNGDNSDKKAFLIYKNTASDPVKATEVFNDLVWNHDIDALIGPLFSEVANSYADLTEDFEIPAITPLSNSNQLVKDSKYLFQLNPNFEVQGRKIGEYAVNYLDVDTVAIIAEKNSYGEQSALAFREVMRENDVEVVQYYVRDLESMGYDIQDFTKILDPDFDTLRTYQIDAIYAPFTGSVAPTLINAMLTEIEAYRNESILLGSEEWATMEYSGIIKRNNPIYYTQTLSTGRTDSLRNEFDREYRLRFSTNPSRFSYIGYDVATVLLNTFSRVQNPDYLTDGLKELNGYQGLSTRVSFRGTQVNEEVKINRISTLED
ncbi:ABC transporter substrate-binding protein [Balneola sp. MJW-20]|uniref:ABC transporter substrate-binding protein n=1 Tax=Gracilimonas aurantiaca TaxID=3234185 RepID=UPI003467B831